MGIALVVDTALPVVVAVLVADIDWGKVRLVVAAGWGIVLAVEVPASVAGIVAENTVVVLVAGTVAVLVVGTVVGAADIVAEQAVVVVVVVVVDCLYKVVCRIACRMWLGLEGDCHSRYIY